MTGRAILCVTLISALTGCSALLTRSPSRNLDQSTTPRCTESRASVVMDGMFIALYGLTSMVALSAGESGVATPLLALGGAHTASALVGSGRVKRCKRAFAAHREWVASEQMLKQIQSNQTRNDPTVGREGKACRANLVCDPGLTCDPDTQICVPESRLAAQPSAAGTPGSPMGSMSSPTESDSADPPTGAVDARSPPSSVVSEPRTAAEPVDMPNDPWAASPPVAEPPAAIEPPPPAPAPEAPAKDSPPPPAEPPPPADSDTPWADFWRESNR